MNERPDATEDGVMWAYVHRMDSPVLYTNLISRVYTHSAHMLKMKEEGKEGAAGGPRPARPPRRRQ